mgnify:CR=1 FL=1
MAGFVEQQLGEALGAADPDRTPGGRPGELADADLEALGLRLGLGDADVLRVLPDEQVILQSKGAANPGVIRPLGRDNYLYVIMPMAR